MKNSKNKNKPNVTKNKTQKAVDPKTQPIASPKTPKSSVSAKNSGKFYVLLNLGVKGEFIDFSDHKQAVGAETLN